jgi:cell pole-organizing protein PopZ
MYFKAPIGAAILAITIVAASAQDDANRQAPKLSVADVQRLAESISRDPSKLRAYCELGKLHDETQQAVEENDAKAIAALTAKIDAFEQQLGPDYDKVLDGLDQIDLSSDDGGQQIADAFKSLQEKCE